MSTAIAKKKEPEPDSADRKAHRVTLTIGSLFSGVGGLELGLEWAGLGPTLWQVEISEPCRRVLARHWPGAKRHEDVRSVGAATLPAVDLICGGFPCQDVSSAGKRAGLAGARSGLWYEFARILAECRPRFVVIENVRSGAAKWVDAVRGDLERLGYASLPIPLAASDCGAPHERARVFVVAHAEPQQRLAAAKSDAAHAHGKLVRIEHRGRRGARRAQAPEPARHPGWTRSPEVPRVAHGLSGRVDRERMLGNAVVPQCAEVIGHVIKQLMEAA